MKRVLEPELMDDAAQARAYAKADFAEENQGFVDRFREYFPDWAGGHVVDLGCGPGDIPIRFLRSFPDARVTAVDASRPMLDLAAEAIAGSGLANRITLCCERFQSLNLPEQADALLVMDLLRPDSPEAAQALVDQYAGDEDPILKRDFYHSLLAAFTEDDVAAQLAEMNLSRLLIDVPDDRHWVVGGILL